MSVFLFFCDGLDWAGDGAEAGAVAGSVFLFFCMGCDGLGWAEDGVGTGAVAESIEWTGSVFLCFCFPVCLDDPGQCGD